MSVLSGRRALVTGGSRGIGAAIVKRLAADGAMVGFTYAASGGSADKLRVEVSAQGGTAVAIQADSADAQQISGAVDEVVAAFGGLDILVNNAGVSTSGIAESFPLQDFDRMLAVNVRGVFVAIQRAIPHLGMGGRIVTTGSIFADRVPRPGSAVCHDQGRCGRVDTRASPRAGAARHYRQCHPTGAYGNRRQSGVG
jgi:3-oxoacyl-[acyl-carrier protein] reductase